MDDKIISLRSEDIRVCISTLGAEIISVTGKDGTEYMWEGNPDIWGHHAPVLFPVCGALKDGKYNAYGESFDMPKHGFARFLDYTAETKGESFVSFKAEITEEYKKCYPYEYDFSAIYSLFKNALSVTYKVVNKDDRPIYFSVGSHEAYSCPGGIENFKIEFEKEEELYNLLTEGSLLSGEKERVDTEGKILKLKESFFLKDSLIFSGIKSEKLSLLGKDEKRRVSVEFPGQHDLVLWMIPGAEYICIEPWTALSDNAKSSGKIEEKPEITKLCPGKTYEITHKIIFGE